MSLPGRLPSKPFPAAAGLSCQPRPRQRPGGSQPASPLLPRPPLTVILDAFREAPLQRLVHGLEPRRDGPVPPRGLLGAHQLLQGRQHREAREGAPRSLPPGRRGRLLLRPRPLSRRPPRGPRSRCPRRGGRSRLHGGRLRCCRRHLPFPSPSCQGGGADAGRARGRATAAREGLCGRDAAPKQGGSGYVPELRGPTRTEYLVPRCHRL